MERFIRKYWFPGTLTVVLILAAAVYAFVNLDAPFTTLPGSTHKLTVVEKARAGDELRPSEPGKLEQIPTRVAEIIPTKVNRPTQTHPATNTPPPTDTPIPNTPTFTPEPSNTAAGALRFPSVRVIVEQVNVRQGPGEHLPVLYKVYQGDVLFVQSKNIEFDQDPWFLIQVRPDGGEEWITGHTQYVRRYNTRNLPYRLTTSGTARP